MTQLLFDLPGIDQGRRLERLEYAVRALSDGGGMQKGEVHPLGEHTARWLTSAATREELPYYGYPQDLELVQRRIVTYTGNWEPSSPDSETGEQ